MVLQSSFRGLLQARLGMETCPDDTSCYEWFPLGNYTTIIHNTPKLTREIPKLLFTCLGRNQAQIISNQLMSI